MNPTPHSLVAALLLPALLVAGAVPTPAATAGTSVTSTEVFTFQDPEITESSGLVRRGDLVFTVNDKGDSGRVFAVDAGTGETVATTRWSPRPTDVEAMAPGTNGRVWVGDVGDNGADRAFVRVAQVRVGSTDRTASPTWFRLRYPSGAQDAEALLVRPNNGRVVVVTKSPESGTVQVAPRRLRVDQVNVTKRKANPVIRMVTDAAFFADGRHFIVRNYTRAAVYSWPDVVEVGQFVLPEQRQGEGLAVRSYRHILISSEGLNQPVLSVSLPYDISTAITPR